MTTQNNKTDFSRTHQNVDWNQVRLVHLLPLFPTKVTLALLRQIALVYLLMSIKEVQDMQVSAVLGLSLCHTL